MASENVRRGNHMTTEQLARQYISGAWREGRGEKILVDRNPFNGEAIAEFRFASVEDIDDAYRSAAGAQAIWVGVNRYQQRTVFEEAARIVEERRSEITELIITELGGTQLKADFEIGLVVNDLKEASTLPLRIQGSILPSPVPDTDNYVYRRPLGVIGIISPFNFPFHLSMKPVAAALATGNGVVLKPHEDTPITGGTLLASIFEEAGLPAGLLNVTVFEPPAIGDYFLEHPASRALIFTGSSGVGRHIAEVGGRNLKKVILELGGNSAFIVCEDADLDYAVDSAVFSRFTHQGQICMCANRILVHASVADDFKQRFTAKVASLAVGDPSNNQTIIGPLINNRQVEMLQAKVDAAIENGAQPLLRGGRDGNILAPTVLASASGLDDIVREELFGPVVTIIEFDSDEQAIAIANDGAYGLSGAVHTRDLARGVQIARQIETGMVHVNDTSIADEPIVPFGGEKASGVGRLNGQASIDELTTTQWVSVNHGRATYPY